LGSFEVIPGAPPTPSDAFLGLGEASRLLGITPATLRRWADRGQIASYTTPGGHRRFPRSALVALLPSRRRRRPQLADLDAHARISHAYRATPPQPRGWLAAVDAGDLLLFRERGRRMTECLLAHLDANGPATAMAALHEATEHAAEYGTNAARLGAGLSEAVESFLRFRSPFVDELAAISRRRGLDTGEATGLLVDAENAMDELLVAFIGGWQEGSGDAT
jgi:excisionase family DNA binding protein